MCRVFTFILLHFTAENVRIAFMDSLPLHHGTTHTIDRSNVYENVITLYTTKKREVLEEFPFRVHFKDEKAFDLGGVSRDLFSAFYEEAYVKLFDGASLLTPVDFPNLDAPLPTLGTIISHVYIIAGILPVKVAFPSLCAMLLPNASSLPDEVLIQSFVDSLSCYDANIVKDALLMVKDNFNLKNFPTEKQSGLLTVFSRFGVREFPKPNNFLKLLKDVSKFHFLRKPASTLAEIRSGIPKIHYDFWKGMSVGELYSIYTALQASPTKVLAMIDEVCTSHENEERVFGYLQQYIGNMQQDEVRSFLRFVTGSSVCSTKAICVTFNALEGLARRPIGHTCSNTIELSSTYVSFLEFVNEFRAVLTNDEFAWKMDAL